MPPGPEGIGKQREEDKSEKKEKKGKKGKRKKRGKDGEKDGEEEEQKAPRDVLDEWEPVGEWKACTWRGAGDLLVEVCPLSVFCACVCVCGRVGACARARVGALARACMHGSVPVMIESARAQGGGGGASERASE